MGLNALPVVAYNVPLAATHHVVAPDPEIVSSPSPPATLLLLPPATNVIGDLGDGGLIDPATGSNTIYLSGSNDTVTGGGGNNNTIYLGGSDNVLTDGPTVFNDTVIGFNQAAGDRIHLTSDTGSDALAHTSVVNSTDMLIALSNGSTILLKWTSHVDASFFS